MCNKKRESIATIQADYPNKDYLESPIPKTNANLSLEISRSSLYTK
jgi:hypothetical protein